MRSDPAPGSSLPPRDWVKGSSGVVVTVTGSTRRLPRLEFGWQEAATNSTNPANSGGFIRGIRGRPEPVWVWTRRSASPPCGCRKHYRSFGIPGTVHDRKGNCWKNRL
jgi:hypothetical protein